jgi:hypothetical protein
MRQGAKDCALARATQGQQRSGVKRRIVMHEERKKGNSFFFSLLPLKVAKNMHNNSKLFAVAFSYAFFATYR